MRPSPTSIGRLAPRLRRPVAAGLPPQRGRILFWLAEVLRSHADGFAEIKSCNSGKPIVEAEGDIEDSASCFEYAPIEWP